MTVQSKLIDQIRVQQQNDMNLTQVLVDVEKFIPLGYSQRGDGLLLF